MPLFALWYCLSSHQRVAKLEDIKLIFIEPHWICTLRQHQNHLNTKRRLKQNKFLTRVENLDWQFCLSVDQVSLYTVPWKDVVWERVLLTRQRPRTSASNISHSLVLYDRVYTSTIVIVVHVSILKIKFQRITEYKRNVRPWFWNLKKIKKKKTRNPISLIEKFPEFLIFTFHVRIVSTHIGPTGTIYLIEFPFTQ